MIKRSLYFGSAAYLKCSKNQLVVKYPEEGKERTMPIEDIGIVILGSLSDYHFPTLDHTAFIQ